MEKTKSIGAKLRALGFKSSEHPICENRGTTQKWVDYCPIIKHGYYRREFISCEECINSALWQTLHFHRKE